MTETMRYRPQRGGLAESLAETVTIERSKAALVAHLCGYYADWPTPDITEATVTVKPYGYDERCDWDTHLVVLEGYGPTGMTDAPLP